MTVAPTGAGLLLPRLWIFPVLVEARSECWAPMGRETVDSVFEGLTAIVGVMREAAQEDTCDGDGPGTDREQASPPCCGLCGPISVTW